METEMYRHNVVYVRLCLAHLRLHRIGVNIGERKRGTQRTKKRELVFVLPFFTTMAWGTTGAVVSLQGSVPMFPGTYVPRYLCSPVPMFPGTDVPRFLYFNSGH